MTASRIAATSIAALLLITGAVMSQGTATAPPKVLVIVNVRSPDFVVRDQAWKAVYAKYQNNHLPIIGYDFKAALTDELMNRLQEDKRFTWQLDDGNSDINVPLLMDDKKAVPPKIPDAKYIYLVDVKEYGAIRNWLFKVCYVAANMKVLNAATGAKVFLTKEGDDPGKEYVGIPHVKLPAPVDELQKDNQKALKEVINQTIEEFGRVRLAEFRKKVL